MRVRLPADGWVPDIDDPVTAAAVLVVVRRAWGDDDICTEHCACCALPWHTATNDDAYHAATEIGVLCAALDAAP